MAWELLFTALILGIIDGATPGPVLTMLIGNLLKSNLYRTLPGYFWASFLDITKAALVILIILSFQLPKELFYWWSIGGGFLLIYFAYGIWKAAKVINGKSVFSLKRLLAIYLVSPFDYLTWPLIYIPLMVRTGEQIRFGEYYFFGLLEGGWMVGTATMLVLVAFVRQLIKNESIMHRAFQGMAIFLFLFGVKMIWDALLLLGLL